MSLRRSVAAAFLAAAVLWFASASQASPWGLARGEFYSELSGGFFSSRSFYRNFDEHRVALGERFDERTVTAHSEFGWKRRATVWVDVPFVSRTLAPDAGSAAAATSTGLGDIGLGLRFAVHRGTLPMALELGWTAPLGTNRRFFPGTSGSGGLDGTSLGARFSEPLSDSGTFFSQGLQSLSASLELGGSAGRRAYWTLGGGMRTTLFSPDGRLLRALAETILPFHRAFGLDLDDVGGSADHTADFATGSASVGFWLRPQLLVGGEFRGEWSVFQGSAYDRVAAPVVGGDGTELEVKRLLAGPRVTYRVDERMDVFAGSWHTAGGRNVLHYDLYYCGIAWKNTSLDRLAGALGGTKAH